NATPGPTGINIDGGASGVSLGGNTAIGNLIENQTIDIAVRTAASTQIDLHLNDLLGTQIGVLNQGAGAVNATQNYWGCPTGRGPLGCSRVRGPGTIASSLTHRSTPEPPDQQATGGTGAATTGAAPAAPTNSASGAAAANSAAGASPTSSATGAADTTSATGAAPTPTNSTAGAPDMNKPTGGIVTGKP